MKFTRQTAVTAGQKTSEAKRQAAVTNGKRGGRPITSPRTLEKIRRKAEAERQEQERSKRLTARWNAWKAEHPDVMDGDDEMMGTFRECSEAARRDVGL
jgi:hypothetical protein